MKSKINLELKYFCPDFQPIRVILKKLGARKVTIKNQTDYFFYFSSNKKPKAPARLKLRVEYGKQTLNYYRRPDFSAIASTAAHVVLLPVRDRNLLPFLAKVLGIKVIVKKKRELWQKGNTVFNLDKVTGIGKVFEIEVSTSLKTMIKDRQKFNEYRKILLPYLGKIIKSSNENLVAMAKK